MKGRLIALMVIAWMVLLAVPMAPAMGEKTGTRGDDGQIVTVWDKTTEGTIYTVIGFKVGYADGTGNFFLSSYIVYDNETLIIKPGVKIFFNGWSNGQFRVYGNIKSIGTNFEPIIFTSNASEPKYLDWDGINIMDDSIGESTFKYCNFEYCYDLYSSRNITVENCTFYESQGISIFGPDKVEKCTIKDCTFEGQIEGPTSYTAGIYVSELVDVDIINNKCFTNNGRYQVNRITGLLTFTGNFISASGGCHITVSGKTRGIVENNVVENGTFDITGNLEVSNNTAKVLGIYFNNLSANIYHNKILFTISLYDLDKQTTPLDLRYNYWGRDWDVEDVLPLKGSEFYSYPFIPTVYPDILFEPYYDSNWTMTDNDGIPNGWEHNQGLNIYENDSGEDPDGDGLTNLQEWRLGGNFTAGGTDPKNSDTDGDQLPDGWEVTYKFDPIGKNESRLDPDLDGWTNLEEFKGDTDPTDPLSHPVKPEDENNTALIIIAVIAGVLVLVILIVLIVFFVRRKNTSNPAAKKKR